MEMGNHPHDRNPIGKQTKVASASSRKLMITAGVPQMCRDDSNSQSAASDLCPGSLILLGIICTIY